ncbi:MAG: hypothetical protein R6X16_05285, partial [Anaerolineae bacterium]
PIKPWSGCLLTKTESIGKLSLTLKSDNEASQWTRRPYFATLRTVLQEDRLVEAIVTGQIV